MGGSFNNANTFNLNDNLHDHNDQVQVIQSHNTLQQDDYSKQKMFQEYFTQVATQGANQPQHQNQSNLNMNKRNTNYK